MKYPHRSRAAMIDYLTNVGGWSTMYSEAYPFAFNCKAYLVDLSWDNVWAIAVKEGYVSEAIEDPSDQRELDAYRTFAYLHYEKKEGHLFYWGMEEAQRTLMESDAYSMISNGTVVDVKWAMRGRSDGWAVITEIEGYELNHAVEDNLEEMLQEMPWPTLQLVYKFVYEMEQKLNPITASREIEHNAVFTLFVNRINPDWEEGYEKAPAPKGRNTLTLGGAQA